MELWKNDKELFSLARERLFTALVGDVMDKMGLLHQFLPQALKPINSETVLIGRAMPVLEMDVFEEVSPSSRDPLLKKSFGVMFEALDDLKEDEIYICTGASPRYALWGGLMSARASKLRAAGAIVNGFHRDTREVSVWDSDFFSWRLCAGSGPEGKGHRFQNSDRMGRNSDLPGRHRFWRQRRGYCHSTRSGRRSFCQGDRESNGRKISVERYSE